MSHPIPGEEYPIECAYCGKEWHPDDMATAKMCQRCGDLAEAEEERARDDED